MLHHWNPLPCGEWCLIQAALQDCPEAAAHMPAAEALLKEALVCCHHPGLSAYLAALLQACPASCVLLE